MVVPRGTAKKSPFALLVLCGLFSLHNNVARANEVEKFYRDKTIDLICSPSAPVSQIYGCDLRRVLVSSL